MKRKEIVQRILDEKLVAIIRNKEQKNVSLIVDALITAGVSTLEITANTPGFEEEIKSARLKYPDVLVGAGTVINLERANKALDAGAQFFVTPNVSEHVVEFAHRHEIPVLMGALTPTEITIASEAGADIIKLFPANNMGIPYLKAIMGPLDGIPLLAVGGIGNTNAKEWMEAGARGIGVGGKLSRLNGTDASGIIEAAKELKNILSFF